MKVLGWQLKTRDWVALALVAIPLQGFVVFWLRQTGGSFFSQAGLECTVVPVFIEVVVGIATAIHYERIHSGAVANPHSLIGKTLSNNSPQPPPPPPAQKAWGGTFEDPHKPDDTRRERT